MIDGYFGEETGGTFKALLPLTMQFIGEQFPSVAMMTALTAFAIAVAATPLVRAAARRRGAVAQPKKDRWHAKPTAMFGGIAIYAAVIAATLIYVPHRRSTWVVLGASTLLFLVGLIDDFLQIKPYQKLVGQIIGSAVVISYGYLLPWTGSTVVNMLITFVWLIGVTNAVNMLDNMDGLSAGVAAIAAIFLAVNFRLNNQQTEAVMLIGFAAALVAFLIYNYNPASIFMGDCGSLFVGFFLASMALLSGRGGGRSRSVIAVLAVPVLVLLVPIFDTTFVTLMRKLAGRAASTGGRDHTSHRLVALGLTERRAVWMLYVLAFSSGTIGLLLRHASIDVSVAAIATFIVILTFLGIHLARVRVYDERELAAASEKPLVSFLLDLSYRRRVFEVLLDVTLAFGAYYLSYVLKFGLFNASRDWWLFGKTVPIVVCVQMAAFLALGVYRGMWRYASLDDALALGRAALVGSIGAVIIMVFKFRFDGFSRTVFAADAVLLAVFMIASRFAFRVLGRIAPMRAAGGRRVLIYGAGDGGELLVRELNNNPSFDYVPVAFADDDPLKAGRLLHGVRVFDAAAGLPAIRRAVPFDEVVLSTSKLPAARVRALIEQCEPMDVAIRRMKIAIERIADSEIGWGSGGTDDESPDATSTIPIDYSLVSPTLKGLDKDH